MNKIKEFAWWYGWLKETRLFLSIAILLSSFGLFFFSAYGISRVIRDDFIWLVILSCTTIITAILFSFFFFVGTGIKFTSNSRNWRLVIDKGWKFTNKNPEALPQIKKLIDRLKHTKDPTQLNKFMENWKSRKQKRAELLKKFEYQLQELKEAEDIMSGKKAEQIKEEIEKTKEEIRKS